MCESCMMPLDKDPMGDKRESDKYCSYCYKDSKLCYEGDLKGFQKVCYQEMRKHGIGPLKATFFTWMIKYAPRWKK